MRRTALFRQIPFERQRGGTDQELRERSSTPATPGASPLDPQQHHGRPRRSLRHGRRARGLRTLLRRRGRAEPAAAHQARHVPAAAHGGLQELGRESSEALCQVLPPQGGRGLGQGGPGGAGGAPLRHVARGGGGRLDRRLHAAAAQRRADGGQALHCAREGAQSAGCGREGQAQVQQPQTPARPLGVRLVGPQHEQQLEPQHEQRQRRQHLVQPRAREQPLERIQQRPQQPEPRERRAQATAFQQLQACELVDGQGQEDQEGRGHGRGQRALLHLQPAELWQHDRVRRKDVPQPVAVVPPRVCRPGRRAPSGHVVVPGVRPQGLLRWLLQQPQEEEKQTLQVPRQQVKASNPGVTSYTRPKTWGSSHGSRAYAA